MALYVYPALVEGNPGAYGAYFPDLPGCITAADTQAELLAGAREALTLHLQGMIEDGETLPAATPLEAIVEDPEAPSIGHLLVDAEVEERPERVNISLPPSALRRIDATAEARGLTRSAYILYACRLDMDGAYAAVALSPGAHALAEARYAPPLSTAHLGPAGLGGVFDPSVPAGFAGLGGQATGAGGARGGRMALAHSDDFCLFLGFGQQVGPPANSNAVLEAVAEAERAGMTLGEWLNQRIVNGWAATEDLASQSKREAPTGGFMHRAGPTAAVKSRASKPHG